MRKCVSDSSTVYFALEVATIDGSSSNSVQKHSFLQQMDKFVGQKNPLAFQPYGVKTMTVSCEEAGSSVPPWNGGACL